MRGILSVVVVSLLIVVGCSGAGGSTPAAAPKTDARPAAEAEPAEPAQPAGQAKPTAAAPGPTAAARPPAAAATSDARARSESAAGAQSAAAARAAAPAAQPARPTPPAPTPASTPAGQPAQPAQPAAVQPAQAGRMVVYTTEIGILVRSLGESVQAMSDVATSLGGYVAGVENKEEHGQPVVTVRLKVPPERYDQAMRQLRGLAVEVTDEKAATQDVTEEFSDVQTQLAALEASHAQLLELLGRAQNVDEILKIQERLAQTKTQIDQLKGRQAFLQRNAELATIAVRARAADDVLARTYTILRTTLRRAETQRAATFAALERARTPEEEAKLRDQLAETTVEIDRATARLKDIEGKAQAIGLTLPVAVDPARADVPQGEAALKEEYLSLRVQLRRAQYDVDRISRELQQRGNPDDAQLRQQLQAALLERDRVEARARVIQERARQAGITLPSPTPEQEAALAGVPLTSTDSDVGRAARSAWEASWRALKAVAVAVVSAVVFLWWALPFLALAAYLIWRRRRPHVAPPASPATP